MKNKTERGTKFKFSVEELFEKYGQSDEYIDIEFHAGSHSAEIFGKNIGGIIYYERHERSKLAAIISSGNIPVTNGRVRFTVSDYYKTTPPQKKQLQETGFMSDDINNIHSLIERWPNIYGKNNLKEISDTTKLPDISDVFDQVKVSIYLFNARIKNGGTLIQSELEEYYGYLIYQTPDILSIPAFNARVTDEDGNLKPMIRFWQLSAGMVNNTLNESELNEFLFLLGQRRNLRFEILKEELEKTTIESIDQFREQYEWLFTIIYLTADHFKEEVLSAGNMKIPVYWDFKSFLHIFFRHCSELQPEGNYKSKSAFYYQPAYIRKSLKIAVKALHQEIEEALAKGAKFSTSGEKTYSYNGDFYQLYVEASGRVISFFPYEKSK